MGRVVTTLLPNPLPPRHVDDCYAIHFFHWAFCNLQLSSHHHFSFWARLYQHVFCKKPLLFLSSSRNRNLGPSGSACGHYAYANPVPLLLATSLVVHEKYWKCLDPEAQGFPVALKDGFHRPNVLGTPAASLASHAIDHSVLLRVLHFYVCFRSLLVYWAGFPVAPHSYFHLLRLLDFRCICLHQIRNPVMKMMKKWVWVLLRNSSINQGLRMAHSLMYCNQFSCHFLWDVVLDRWSSGSYTSDLRRVFPSERTAGVSSRSITVTNKSNSWTHTVASSLVCTSPLAVITVVGLLDVLMVSNSAEFGSRLLAMWHTRSGIHYKLSFLRLFLLTQPGVPILPRASGL